MFKNIILFPHKLGQKKDGVNLAYRFVKSKKNIICPINNNSHNNNLKNNLQNLYNINQKLNGSRINIGGDHSMSIATLAYSLNNFSNLKVLWVDAHADINTLSSSPSGNYHGMPLSFLTGLEKNHSFDFIKNNLNFKNLLYIGLRDIDEYEKEILYKYKINIISSGEFNKINFNKIDRFINNSNIHLSLDVDSLDPKYFPSTGTPVPNGLNLNKLLMFLYYLRNKNVVNCDLTEFNPKIGNDKEKLISYKSWNKILKILI